MRQRAQISFLPDGRRLHMQDGPIDLVIEAFGRLPEIRKAYRNAGSRFVEVLDELCAELPLLREQVRIDSRSPQGRVALRMFGAVRPYCERSFITAMAAVAGAVAEEILEAMISNAELSKAYVNNGGDIAVHLSCGERLLIGMVDSPDGPALFGTASLHAEQPIRGIATSGWRGRSFTLGIADAVTVLADSASAADAAATVIANAVDLPGHPSILRAPASSIVPDSDLRNHLVTQHVGKLASEEINRALETGVATAEQLRSEGLVHAVALHLRGETRIVGSHFEPVAVPTSIHLDKHSDSRRPIHA